MDYSHTCDQAQTFASAALQRMREMAIAPHPNNYAVWYSYCSGEVPDLNAVLDALVCDRQEFTDERNQTLFRRFFATAVDVLPVHLIAEKVEAELTAVLGALETTVAVHAKYGESLEQVGKFAEGITQPLALRRLLTAIIDKTRAVARQSCELEGQLRQSCQEVGSLREQLESAKREAMTDALTGLANRKMLDFVLREATMEAMETGDPLSLLLLDIDHFKQFNDSYGHIIGDHVLKLLAVTLRDSIKGQDTAARYGGEEFAVILPRTNATDACKLAENIRQRIANKAVINRKTGGTLGRVCVSVGVGQMRMGESIRHFVERTDKALYTAKRTGRNRVIAATDDLAELSPVSDPPEARVLPGEKNRLSDSPHFG
ncbi:MAG: GGDEF domain-containing protein [Rhodospirillales bacterium]